MKYIIILLIALLLIAGCKPTSQGGEIVTKKQIEQPVDISLRTSDEMSIKGTFYPNSDSRKGLILLHQLNMDRKSYSEWAVMFQKTHNVLAIDLRGHGESSGNWKEFNDSDFQAMEKDIDAARDFLRRKEISEISLIGASIGANTVQNYVNKNEVDKAVLLSPGETFRGIKLDMSDSGALVISSEEDTYSYDSAKMLQEVSPTSQFIYLKDKGHGTNMLDKELVNKIIDFLNG